MDRIINLLINVVWIMSLICMVAGLYQLFISIFSIRRHPSRPACPPSHTFTILIAARNEGLVIGQLLDSLFQQNYPRHLYNVVVIPNNCTDETESIARSHGATILSCTVPVRSKGQVLSYFFDHLSDHLRADAYCVFDADNIVHPDFLSHMNRALSDGHQVAQGYRDSKNPHDTVFSACMSIFYWINNRFVYHARSVLKLSAMINGTGFMISDALLNRMGGWRTYSMAEDFEFTFQCISFGEKIAWVPEAVTFDEQPMTFRQSWRQRQRWTMGVLQCIPRYFRQAIQNVIRHFSFQNLDVFMNFIVYLVQYLSVFLALFGFILRLVILRGPLFPLTPLYDQFIQSISISMLLPVLVALAAVVLEGKLNFRILKGVLMFWFFMATWIIIYLVGLFLSQRNFEWLPIHHTRDIGFKDLSVFSKK